MPDENKDMTPEKPVQLPMQLIDRPEVVNKQPKKPEVKKEEPVVVVPPDKKDNEEPEYTGWRNAWEDRYDK